MSNKLTKHEGHRSYYPSLFNRFFGDDVFDFLADNNLPAVNIKETKKEFNVEISAPGFDKNNFSIWVDGNVLIITANDEKSVEKKDDDGKILRREFISSSFSRSFSLPDNINTEKIETKEKNGILRITLPKDEKAAENTVKHIEIK